MHKNLCDVDLCTFGAKLNICMQGMISSQILGPDEDEAMLFCGAGSGSE
jgi:hypothetical protein